MEFKEIIEIAQERRNQYAQAEIKVMGRPWGALERTQGFMGDAGNLMRLVMAKKGLRKIDNLDIALARELSDCLWSVLIIADELNIDIEKEFINTMENLKNKIEDYKKYGSKY